MDFDDMLEELGEFGRFQIITYTLVCLPVLFAAANSLSYVFTAGEPAYRCFVPECEHPHDASYKAPWTSWALPSASKDNSVIGVKIDGCERFAVDLHKYDKSNGTCNSDMFDRKRKVRCSDGWIFDKEERTIVNDWNITCLENRWKLSLVGTSHFTGILAGSGLFGVLADKYGRKLIFLLCIYLMTVTGAAQVLSPEYITFVVLIFFSAMATSGVYPLAFIIGVEMVGKRKREITGTALNYFYAIGEAFVALVAWRTKNWVHLQLVVSTPSVVFISYYWLVPESIRWLLANEKRDKAKKIICKVAKINKVQLSTTLLDSFKEGNPHLTRENSGQVQKKIWPVVKQMIKSKKLVFRFLSIYYIWAVNAFVYYGLSINSTSVNGNKYLNFALVSLIEIPGYALAWMCIKKLGRRKSLVLSLFLCGVTCTLTIFAPKMTSNWMVVLLFLVGKLGITASFCVVYVHTAEMLPTIVRSGGVGVASTFARVGALTAPFVPLLGVYWKPLPMVSFGTAAITAGLLAFTLPETYGIKLPETVDEAEKM